MALMTQGYIYVYVYVCTFFFQSNDNKITFMSLYNVLCHVCICLPLTLIGYSCAVNKILFYSIPHSLHFFPFNFYGGIQLDI